MLREPKLVNDGKGLLGLVIVNEYETVSPTMIGVVGEERETVNALGVRAS